MSLPFPIRSKRAALLLLVLCTVSAPHSAHAQASPGDFVPFGSWWLNPSGGTLGIFYDGTQIRIDRDGDGGAESLFLRPTGQTGIPDAAIGSLRLTPTRTIVYAFGGTCQGDGTLVHFYRVPASGNRLEPIRTGLCIPGPIQRVHFYDTGNCTFNGFGLECAGRLGVSPRRIAMFLTPADEFGYSNLIWVDLSTGDVSGPAFDFENGIGFIHVSPSGTQAFLQHDLDLTTTSDYRLIDLCPGTLGTVINPGGFPITDSPEILSAEVVPSGTIGQVEVEVKNDGDVVRDTAVFTDCLQTAGACCYANGGCFDTGTIEACGGTFLGAGTACSECPPPVEEVPCCIAEAEPACSLVAETACTDQGGTPHPEEQFCAFDLCPQPDPVLTLVGPESGSVGDVFDYQLAYQNQGGVVTRGVVVEVQMPYGVRDVAVANGGEFDTSSNAIRWTLGDLAPGASGAVNFSFRLGCEDPYLYLQGSLTYQGPGGGFTIGIGSNTIQFEATPAAAASLLVTTTTTPDRAPLLPGDEVRHAITLTNPGSTAAEGVQIGSEGDASPDGVRYGTAQGFDRTLAAGGGAVDAAANQIGWTVDVPAGQSRTLEFVTQIASCIPGGADETQLNFGTGVAAFDACGTPVGASTAPVAVAVESNLDASLAATNLSPAVALDAPAIRADVQVLRPGGAAQVQLALTNNTAATLNGASLQVQLRGFNVTTPPTGPGFSWNPGNSTLSWSGSVPAGAPITVGLAGNVGACRAELRLTGSSASGCTDLYESLYIAAIPTPPAGPWLAGFATRTHPFEPNGFETHVVRIDPDAPAVETMLCLPTEYPQGLAGAPDGSIWTTWLPSLRFNPATLAFESILLDDLAAAGLESVSDVAVDPVDGAAYFSGNHLDVQSLSTVATVIRRDPGTGAYAPYLDEPSLRGFGEIAVDAAGSIVAVGDSHSGSDRVARIDPGASPSIAFFDQAGGPVDVAIDGDGTAIALQSGFAPPSAVWDVDTDAPAATQVLDLDAAYPGIYGWRAVEVDATGRVFAVPYSAGLLAIDRGASVATEAVFPIGGFTGHSFLDLAMVSLPAPEPAAAVLGVAALGALASLRAGGRRS